MKPSFVFSALVLVGLALVSSAQNSYVVLDSLGWIIPLAGSVAYRTWAANKTLKVGDTLVFNFITGQHNVAKVTKATYDSCSGTNPISLITTGPANITLDATGEHYFICTFGTHCSLGQKLAINVTGSSSSSLAPSPTPTTLASVPPPAGSIDPQRKYVVLDSLGWIIPPAGSVAYKTWAANKTFKVGDTLEFNFITGQHNAAKVTKAAYDSCSGTNPISLTITGPANITLDAASEHYFICTIGIHCSLGQKLAINVTRSSSSSLAPSPTRTTSASAPAPAGLVGPQNTYAVLDSLGWIIPPTGSVAYRTWAANKTFKVGDTLEFNFTIGQHNVAKVTKAAYDSCSSTNPISLTTIGPANITLDAVGEHYFICTISTHCSLGQKLAINVTGSSSSSSPPSPTPTTSASAPASAGSVDAKNAYVVLDSLGWTIPPTGAVTYTTWAANKTFTVGDSLEFNFTTGQHNVAKVTKVAYDSCSGTNPISLTTTGPVNITLDVVGEHYFICTIGTHCSLGQKLAINVTGSSSSSLAPSPTPTTSAFTPTPAGSISASNTYVVLDSLGWTIPPTGAVAYTTWVANKTLIVGDTLEFNFTTGQHNVAKVTKAAYDSCSGIKPISLTIIGPGNITLDAAGEHYFICTIGTHCSLGQKLAINVTGSSTTTPPSSIGVLPSMTTNPTSTTPTALAPGNSSAKSISVTGLSAIILSIVVALWI